MTVASTARWPGWRGRRDFARVPSCSPPQHSVVWCAGGRRGLACRYGAHTCRFVALADCTWPWETGRKWCTVLPMHAAGVGLVYIQAWLSSAPGGGHPTMENVVHPTCCGRAHPISGQLWSSDSCFCPSASLDAAQVAFHEMMLSEYGWESDIRTRERGTMMTKGLLFDATKLEDQYG